MKAIMILLVAGLSTVLAQVAQARRVLLHWWKGLSFCWWVKPRVRATHPRLNFRSCISLAALWSIINAVPVIQSIPPSKSAAGQPVAAR